MDAEMCNEKTKIAVDNFFNLEGDTFNRKKKSLNTFIKQLRSDFSLEEIGNFIENLNTKTEYDQALKAEIIIHFQLETQIWNILKSGNEPSICRILKNWVFFKSIFKNITVDSFVNEVLPLLSYKTNVKVVKVIGKNLGCNEQLSDDFFMKLEEKYGINTAMILLPNCSINLIKEKCSKYNLYLSSRCLLQIYKKDSGFLAYYFNLTKNINHKNIFFKEYVQLLKYVAQTNLQLFWQLHEEYKFSFYFGKRRTQKLLPDKESVVKYGFAYDYKFKMKHILNVVRREGVLKEFLLNFYPDYLSDYLKQHLAWCSNVKIVHMPRAQVFPLLNELFKRRYDEDLTNYLHLMDKRYLKYVTMSEREFILDRLKDNEDWSHYYPTNRSVPIIKEKLKSANDHQTRRQLIEYLYVTCEINNDAKMLLDIIKLIHKRYRNDTSALSNFMINLTKWKNCSEFTEEHWEVINNLIEYLTYSSNLSDDHNHNFFENYFVWLVDNNKSYNDLLDEYMKKRKERGFLYRRYSFSNSLKHMSIFIEEIHKRLEKSGTYSNLCLDFLHLAIHFNKQFPNKINILNYSYILDLAVEHSKSQQAGQIYYFIKHFNKNKSFNKYIKYFEDSPRIYPDMAMCCLRNHPEELDNFKDLLTKTSWTKKEFRQFLLCPHFIKKYSDSYKRIALDELRDSDAEIHENLLYFLGYEEFLETIQKFDPPKDGKIDPQTSMIFIRRHQMIIRYIPKMPRPQSMELVRKFCKGDYLKYALSALYKIAYTSPEILILDFLRNIYQAGVSVKKHALYLGRHLLPVNLYYDFLLRASEKEINMSMRNILLKKSLEYFIEKVDMRFFELFVKNLDKIDKKDRDLYDYLLDYKTIPRAFKTKYITVIYDNIINNKDSEISKKRFKLMESLPDYLIDDLELDFMKNYLSSTTIDTTTKFINKCLFHTTGSKYDEIRTFIFNLIINKLKECDSSNVKLTKDISGLISKICSRALNCGNHNIVSELHEIVKTNVPPHCFITTKLILDFNKTLTVSDRGLDIFVNHISTHLQEFTKLYSNSISLYAKELQSFLGAANLDKFAFIEKLFKINPSDENICLLAISFLPSHLPTKNNAHAKYLPLLESLGNVQIPSVVAHLDVYFFNALD